MRAVVDASVLAEYLVGTRRGVAVAAHLEGADELHLPHLAIVETASVLRGWVLGGQLDAQRAESALIDLADFPAHRWPAEPLLDRIWALRRNVSTYDATYLALAESLDATLLTADARLARGAGDNVTCEIRLAT